MTRADLRSALDAQAAARAKREREEERARKLERYMTHRRHYLPKAIEAARMKLIHLEREAERMGVAW